MKLSRYLFSAAPVCAAACLLLNFGFTAAMAQAPPNRADILQQIKDGGVPLLIVPGDADTVVPPGKARIWADTAKELHMDFKYVELPGIDHGPVITASQKAVSEFFAQHTKK